MNTIKDMIKDIKYKSYITEIYILFKTLLDKITYDDFNLINYKIIFKDNKFSFILELKNIEITYFICITYNLSENKCFLISTKSYTSLEKFTTEMNILTPITSSKYDIIVLNFNLDDLSIISLKSNPEYDFAINLFNELLKYDKIITTNPNHLLRIGKLLVELKKIKNNNDKEGTKILQSIFSKIIADLKNKKKVVSHIKFTEIDTSNENQAIIFKFTDTRYIENGEFHITMHSEFDLKKPPQVHLKFNKIKKLYYV